MSWMLHKVSLKQNLTGLNSEFFFSSISCYTKIKEANLPFYLPISGERRVEFIPFLSVLVLCER